MFLTNVCQILSSRKGGVDMAKKARGMQKPQTDMRKVMSIVLTVLFPPAGIILVWKSRWTNTAKYCLSTAAVIWMALIIALLPVMNMTREEGGGVEIVRRKPSVQVYGPEFPTAMVTGYIAPQNTSVIYNPTDDPSQQYVYCNTGTKRYHLENCDDRRADDVKTTLYGAYYNDCKPCTKCSAPVYAAQ